MVTTKERIIQPATNRLSWVEATSVAVLFLSVLVSRLLFITHYLYHWDSVNFAFSLVKFNLEKDQPQPPGYIVYVWLVQLVNSLIHDPSLSMVLLSVLASSLAVVVFYFLGKAMFGPRTGGIAAMFLAVSPLFWFYGEIALPHTLDALFVIAAAWLLYRVMRGELQYLIPSIIVLAIAGGIRQQTLLFLGPLALFSLRKVGWKNFGLALLVGVVLCLAWFIPLILMSGGLASYMRTVNAFSNSYQSFTSVTMGAGLTGLRHNLAKLIPYTLYGLFLASIPYLLLIQKRFREALRRESWEKWLFLGLWALPAIVFYIFIHMGQQGLVFVFLPALILFGAFGLNFLVEKNIRFLWSIAVIVVISVAFFLWTPEYPLGSSSQRLLTRQTLANSDAYYQGRLAVIQSRFSASSTIILASNWHHIQYYLPQYPLLRLHVTDTGNADDMVQMTVTTDNLKGTPDQLGLHLDTSQKDYLVIFDPNLIPYNQTMGAPEVVQIPGTGPLFYYQLNPNDVILINNTAFSVIRK